MPRKSNPPEIVNGWRLYRVADVISRRTKAVILSADLNTCRLVDITADDGTATEDDLFGLVRRAAEQNFGQR